MNINFGKLNGCLKLLFNGTLSGELTGRARISCIHASNFVGLTPLHVLLYTTLVVHGVH